MWADGCWLGTGKHLGDLHVQSSTRITVAVLTIIITIIIDITIVITITIVTIIMMANIHTLTDHTIITFIIITIINRLACRCWLRHIINISVISVSVKIDVGWQ